MQNWKKLPKPVEKKIEELFSFINPPTPDEELAANLDSLKSSIKTDITYMILTHTNIQLSKNSKGLKDSYLNDMDVRAAKYLAEKVIKRKYAKKQNNELIQ